MSFDLRPRRRAGAVGPAFAQFAAREEIPFARKGICFLQHDFDAANGSGATVRADFNNAIEALATLSSGATEPSTTYQYQLWADTTAGLLKQRNAANGAWEVRGTLAETLAVSRSSNTIIAASDFGKTFICTSTFTQTLTAAATLGDGFMCWIRNDGTGVITVDANSTETIDGTQVIELLPGESCLLFCDASNWKTVGRVQSAVPALFPGFIFGLELSNNAGDAANDIDIAAGRSVDATGVVYMRLAAALTKRLDAAWAVGSGNGGLDTGAIGNNTYFVHLIKRVDTGVVDALFSLSATAPTMPANYGYARRIGAIIRSAGAILGFFQDGDRFMFKVPINDLDATVTATANRTARTLTAPPLMTWIGTISFNTSAVGVVSQYCLITTADMTDTAPTATLYSIIGRAENVAATGIHDSEFQFKLNSSAQLFDRGSSAGSMAYKTRGWIDTRGRLAA